MSLDLAVSVVLAVAAILYLLTGGADFGGGVLALLSRGKERESRRAAVESAIAPIWEANHVWLILIVVILFVCFPRGYAAISTALHIPLTALLLAIVGRGSAFVFRQYGRGDAAERRQWDRIFGWSSLCAAFLLGDIYGALLSHEIRLGADGIPTGFFLGWTSPIAVSVGLLVVTQTAFLASVYLAAETNGALRESFRRSALRWGVALGAAAALALGIAARGAPGLASTLLGGGALAFHVFTGCAAIAALTLLGVGRVRGARTAAIVQAALVAGGGVFSLHPFLIPPDLTLSAAAAPPVVLRTTLIVLAAGSTLLLPALGWLVWVFKRGALLRSSSGEAEGPAGPAR